MTQEEQIILNTKGQERLEKLGFLKHHQLCKDCLNDHVTLIDSKLSSKGTKKELKEIHKEIRKNIIKARYDQYIEFVAKEEVKQLGYKCKYNYIYLCKPL